MKKISIEVSDEVYAVADALRRSYYEDNTKNLEGTSHPLQWIRMAQAAIVQGNKYRSYPAPPLTPSRDDVDRLLGN